MKEPNDMKCDVLLVTVTDIETVSLFGAAKALTNRDYKERKGQHKTYFDLGIIGDARVFVVRSEMGADTVGGSLPTIINAIMEVKPSEVIMVGIAFGVDSKKQKVGDILVAKQLQPYELQRVGTTETGERKIILRGDKPHCSEKLLDRFRATGLRWKKAKVRFGLVLSGQKLIDNINFRDQLFALSEEAIGGEMEGGGLYVACHQSKVDWILVKAICDWADGKKGVGKEQNQQTAAQNAAEFVIEMLASGLLAKSQSADSISDPSKPQPEPSSPLAPDKISIARLPTSGPDLFGRDAELQLLDEAWANPDTNIITFIAWGGVGKTALVNHWLKQRMARDNYRGAERIYGWSFYSQGTNEQATSADLFIDKALRWLGDKDPTQGSPWDKGERLADFIRKTRTLLVLDGLEPLQHPPGPQEGRLKDAALQALLVELAAQQTGLCVISTRERVGDLSDFENGTVVQHQLEHLSPQAGAQLLLAQKVKGDDNELEQAAKEYAGHALALTLLGSYLADVCGGDIRRRIEIESLGEDVRHGRHAERVMRAYEKWLGEGVELAVLRLLGLFDRPAEASSIAALCNAPVIPGLTEPLFHLEKRSRWFGLSSKVYAMPISNAEWLQALAKLRRIQLLGAASAYGLDTLDAHPLVRDHFRQQLKRERPGAWREANNRLYEHLTRSAKEFPDTIEEIMPLYDGVVHGCAAGRYQDAALVYGVRIRRGDEGFSTGILGIVGADLAVLSSFFDRPWGHPVSGLPKQLRLYLLLAVGRRLALLGRLQEAAQPTQAALEAHIALEQWMTAGLVACNLSEIYLTIGDLAQSLRLAHQCVELADRDGNEFMQTVNRTTLASVLHQAGRIQEAAAAFQEAEQRQKQRQPKYPILYSLGGFKYCDLLLAQGQAQAVKERAAQMIKWEKEGRLRDTALDNTLMGRALLLEAQQSGTGDTTQAVEFLQRAVEGLRQANDMTFLPSGLLARAELHRFKEDYVRAERDLAEVLRIATRGGMGLHLADYHLESARLHLAQGNQDKAREHLATAKEMIERMGYHRRDNEVEEIAQQLG